MIFYKRIKSHGVGEEEHDFIIRTPKTYILVKHIKYKMYSSFEKLWLESMPINKSDPEKPSKLRTYSKLIFEPYLDKIKNINERTCFTRFRISVHKLKIERGRYSRPIIPAIERYCDICNNGEIADEVHFLYRRSSYNDIRNK